MGLNTPRRAVLVAIVAAGLAPEAEGQDLLRIGASVVSRRLYQGYDRGDGWSLAPEVDLGLGGFAATSIGRWGVFLDLEGGLLLEDRDAHPGSDDLALALSYERKLGSDDRRLRATYRQSFYSERAHVPSHSEEVLLRFQTLLSLEKPGFNVRPYTEVAYDFNRYDGVYAAVGFEHSMSLVDRLGLPASIDVAGRLAWSDRRAGDLVRSRTFGFHHAGIDLAVPFERELVSSGRTLVLGPVVGWDWAAEAVRGTGGFAWGVRIALER